MGARDIEFIAIQVVEAQVDVRKFIFKGSQEELRAGIDRTQSAGGPGDPGLDAGEHFLLLKTPLVFDFHLSFKEVDLVEFVGSGDDTEVSSEVSDEEVGSSDLKSHR